MTVATVRPAPTATTTANALEAVACSPQIARHVLIPLLVLCLLSLNSCFQYHDPEKKLLSDIYYEQPGDVFSWSSSVVLAYANGSTESIATVNTNQYSQVDVIPATYAYSNSVNGPYLFTAKSKDGVDAGVIYANHLNVPIIEDDLTHFTNSDHLSYEGTAKPREVSLGDTFRYDENAVLFATQNGRDVGQRSTALSMMIADTESVMTPAGTFNAVRIAFDLTITTSVNGVDETDSSSGDMWLERDNGVLLRMLIPNGTTTLTAQGLSTTYTLEWLLQSYSRSGNAATISENPGDARQPRPVLATKVLDSARAAAKSLAPKTQAPG